MINRIAVPNPCRKDGVNDLICCLKGIQVGVHPRRLRISDLLDDKANEFIAEVLSDVRWEILYPGIDFRPFLHSWQGKRWEWGLLELDLWIIS